MDLNEEKQYLVPIYTRFPLVIERGEGVYVFDEDGNRYLDFASGIAVNSLGYSNPKVIEVAISQIKNLVHISNLYFNKPQVVLAKRLVNLTGLDKVFFCNSGTESVEAALKFARRWGKNKGKYKFISTFDSFHGRTLGSLSVTGQSKYQDPFKPLLEGVTFIRFGDIDELEKTLKEGSYCGVILEPIQGEGGINIARKEFLEKARVLCDRYDALLIFDEVQTGIGRTGKMFAFQHFNVTPDILTLAKGLGGGFPIGATIIKEKVAESIHYGDHASTFGGNPFVTSVAKVVLDEVEKLLPQIERVGTFLDKTLRERFSLLEDVEEIRGLGLMYGIDVKNSARSICERCIKEGLLIITCGKNTIRIVPPLVIREEEVLDGIEILYSVMKEGVK